MWKKANTVPFHCPISPTHSRPSKYTIVGNMTMTLKCFLSCGFVSLCSGTSGCDSCHRISFVTQRELLKNDIRCFLMIVIVWLNYRKCIAGNVLCFVKRSETFSIIKTGFFCLFLLSAMWCVQSYVTQHQPVHGCTIHWNNNIWVWPLVVTLWPRL